MTSYVARAGTDHAFVQDQTLSANCLAQSRWQADPPRREHYHGYNGRASVFQERLTSFAEIVNCRVPALKSVGKGEQHVGENKHN
jgi:hypothetical protein